MYFDANLGKSPCPLPRIKVMHMPVNATISPAGKPLPSTANTNPY